MKFFVSTFFFTDKSSQKVVFCKDQCSCPSMDILRWEKYFKRTDKYKTYAGFFQRALLTLVWLLTFQEIIFKQFLCVFLIKQQSNYKNHKNCINKQFSFVVCIFVKFSVTFAYVNKQHQPLPSLMQQLASYHINYHLILALRMIIKVYNFGKIFCFESRSWVQSSEQLLFEEFG